MGKEPKKVVSITMSKELYEIIRSMAEEDSRSVSSVVRQILKKHIRELGLHDHTSF